MAKNVWGPIGWAWLHAEALNLPEQPTPEEQIEARRRFWAFLYTLPCPECRDHSLEYSRAHPPLFSSSAAYQAWAWRFHNAVNYRLRKPLMSRAEYLERYYGVKAGLAPSPYGRGAYDYYDRYKRYV